MSSSKGGKAAPDVDLRSQGGLSNHFIVAGVAITCALVVYSRSGSSPAQDGGEVEKEDAEEEVRWAHWLFWLVLRLMQMLLGGAVIMLGVLVVQQRKILYVPVPPGTQRSTRDNPSMYRSPEQWGLPFENLMIPTEDGIQVNAWLVYQPLATCAKLPGGVPYTLLYFHGNAGNIGHRLENIRDMHDKLKVNILIVDYRGFGDSEDGAGPTQAGFMMDALATHKWLIDRIRNKPEVEVTKMSEERILFFGRSIGGAVAISLMTDLLRMKLDAEAGEKPLPLPVGLVLENTFTSLKDMAMQIFPFLSFVSILLRPPLVFDPWDSTGSLDFLTKNHDKWCCCLLSGLQDQIVPPEQMNRLHSILKERRPNVLKFFRFPHGGHNDTPTRGGADYWISFQKFMGLVLTSEEERREAGADGTAGAAEDAAKE